MAELTQLESKVAEVMGFAGRAGPLGFADPGSWAGDMPG